MKNPRPRFSLLCTVTFVFLSSCGEPPPIAKTGPPAPPPPAAPAPEPKPAPSPPQPDPFEKAMTEVNAIIKRYATVYASVKDEATADKAVAEIGQMTARLRELTTEIAKLPYQSGQEKHALTFQTELTQMQTAQLTNPDLQRVLGDPDLGLKFIAAHQSFATEGLLPLAQALVARQPAVPQQPAPSPTPPTTPK